MRIIEINGFDVEMTPSDTVMIIFNNDKPGVIGDVGTVLGKHGINIQTMGVGQKAAEKKAILAVSIDAMPDEKTIKEISELDFVNEVYLCKLG
jgi:D-3-phosphoglycerate dehydrogenase